MTRAPRRVLTAVMVLTLLVAACGDDAATTTTSTTGAAPTTTAPWGEAIAPGAEAMLQGASALLREDFQDGDTAGWQVDSGWFILENGERRAAGAGGVAWAWYPDGLGWSRYGARLAVLVNQGSLAVSVAVSQEGRYVIHLSDAGVYLLKDAPFGSISALGSAQPVALGDPHVLAVGLDGGHIQVYVDGRLLIDAVDGAPLPGGSIGLGAGDGSAVVVDNIVVAALGGPLPDIQAVGEPADAALPPDLGDGAPGSGEGLEGGAPSDPDLPNLVLTGVSCPTEVAYDQAFDVSFTVRNTGAAAGSFAVAFQSYGGECEDSAAGLATGEEVTLSCRFPGYSPDGAAHEWTAAADSRGEIDEGTHEDDNLAAGIITTRGLVPEETLPNLGVGFVDWDPLAPGPADVITITVSVSQMNLEWAGTLAAVGFRVFYEGGNTACSGTARVSGVQFSGTCQIVPFNDSGEYWLNVVVDERDEVAESNEEDNALIVPIQIASTVVLFQPNLTFLQMLANGGAPIEAGRVFAADIVWDSNVSDSLPPYTVRMLIDDVVVCSQDLTQPRGATSCMVTAPATAGNHVWVVQIDADNDIAELDETDNDRSGVLRVEE